MSDTDSGDLFQKIIYGYLFVTLVIFAPYYNWQYAKEHDLAQRLFFGEVTATAKAFVWPYFLLQSSVANAQASGDGAQALRQMTKAINASNEVAALLNQSSGTGAVRSISADQLNQLLALLSLAQREAERTDIDALNRVYPGLGDHFKIEFLPGIRSLRTVFETSNGPLSLSGYAMLDRWGNWYQSNLRGIRGNGH